jgi:hypothetical protein
VQSGSNSLTLGIENCNFWGDKYARFHRNIDYRTLPAG